MLVQRISDLLVGEKLRIGIGLSIAALVVSTATLILVLMLFFIEQRASSEHHAEHSQDLTVTMVQTLIENHANVLIKSNGRQLYESRFQFFTKKDAKSACARLKKYKRDCFIRG